jgi:gluconokinase
MPSSLEPPYVLTIDAGTSSVRALLFDRRARPVPGVEGRRVYRVRATPDGGAELDAEELRDRVEHAIDDALLQAGPDAAKIAAVACCTFWHSLVAVGEDESPLTPVFTWADTRSNTVSMLRELLDEEAIHERTGCVFHPSYWPARLLWLYRNDEALFYRVERWMSFGEYLHLRLFGRAVASVSMASATGLLDIRSGAWDEEVLEAVSVRSGQLWPLGEEPLRGLRVAYGKRWPALRDVPWFPPVGDGACNSLGSGCMTAERVALMVGTSGATRVVHRASRAAAPEGLFCYRQGRDRYVVGGALSEGGNLVEWIRETFRVDPVAAEREVAAMPPDGHGLTFLPFIAGERAPGWAGDARAAIAGIGLSTRPLDVLRAGLEAVALRFAIIHERLAAAVPEAREVVATGGALLRSPSWMQIMADALGRVVIASAEPEASSRGAALLALEGLGLVPRIEDLPAALGAAFAPDAARHDAYRGALDRQRWLYDLLVRS